MQYTKQDRSARKWTPKSAAIFLHGRNVATESFSGVQLAALFTWQEILRTARRPLDAHLLFLTQEIEEGEHRISDRIPVQRHVYGLPDENLSVSITGEVGGFQKPAVTLSAIISLYHAR